MCTLSSPGPSGHPQIRLRKLSNGELCRDIQLHSHTPGDVATAIKSYASLSKDRTDDQWQALEDFKRLRRMSDTNMKDRNVLLNFLHVSDRMFFFGALRNNCELRVVEVISETERGLVGLTQSCPESQMTVITIGDHSIFKPGLFGEALVDEYLGTLLHEALHAMFHLYVCRQDQKCSELYFNEVGSGGHKVRWKQAAKEIQTASARMGMARGNPKAGLDLGIETSIDIDLK